MSATRRRKCIQGELAFPEVKRRGGARKGAGRKPKGECPGMPHVARPEHKARFPVLVTLKLSQGLPSMRNRKLLPELEHCFRCAKEKAGFRLTHYGVLGDHVHLIVEADDRVALSRGVQGLTIRLARTLNRLWQRAGKIFTDRFHARALQSPKEVRVALVYVLRNARKHLGDAPPVDAFTSACWFDGFKECARECFGGIGERTVAAARSWLLRTGWKIHGAITFRERPATG